MPSVMVGAALSRECIAHECAPTEISNMADEKVASQFSSGYWSFVDKQMLLLMKLYDSIWKTFPMKNKMTLSYPSLKVKGFIWLQFLHIIISRFIWGRRGMTLR